MFNSEQCSILLIRKFLEWIICLLYFLVWSRNLFWKEVFRSTISKRGLITFFYLPIFRILHKVYKICQQKRKPTTPWPTFALVFLQFCLGVLRWNIWLKSPTFCVRDFVRVFGTSCFARFLLYHYFYRWIFGNKLEVGT